MRKLLINQVQPGTILGRSILSVNGSVLVREGTPLRPDIIAGLRRKGVPALYIRDPDPAAEVEVPDVVSERSRLRAMITVQGVMRGLEEDVKRGRPVGRVLQDPRIRRVTEDLLDQVLSNREMAVSLADIRSRDDFHFSHSVQVCILSMMTGNSMGFDLGKLRELGIGALLHDIGNVRVPKEIINKRGPLTPEEFEEEKRHTEYGFDILRRQQDLSLLAAHVAYQHHERYNGEGYPRGLRGDEIHEMARIVSVVDTYDALTGDRPFRRAYLPHEAAEMLGASGDYLFDYRVLAAFLENVALYPVGSWVQLSDGSKGLVTEVVKRMASRPTVRLVIDPQGGRYQPPREIRLVDHLTMFVTRVFTGTSALMGESLDVAESPAVDVNLLKTGSIVAAGPGQGVTGTGTAGAATGSGSPLGLADRLRAMKAQRAGLEARGTPADAPPRRDR